MQGANLERELKVRVMDRAEVILDIFSTRARSHEAKLQVELAQLEYLLPRLRRMWTHLSRIRGGIGLRGPGETQLETDRRMIRHKIQWLKGKLRDVERHRETIRAGPSADAERQPRGVHQRRQVERPARTLRPARDRGRRPALRHPRHADPRSGPRRGLPRADHRHGRVSSASCRTTWSPASAPRWRRRAPPTCSSMSWTPAIPDGKSRWTWSNRCSPSWDSRTGRCSRCSTRWTACPMRRSSAGVCPPSFPGRS